MVQTQFGAVTGRVADVTALAYILTAPRSIPLLAQLSRRRPNCSNLRMLTDVSAGNSSNNWLSTGKIDYHC